MNYKIFLIPVISLLLISYSTCFSQVSDSLFQKFCEDEDLIILDMDVKVTISGKKTLLMNATVSKKQTIVIKTEEGLKEFQPLIIPENIDPLIIHHSTTERNIEWSYNNITINEFNASHKGNDKPLDINNKTIDKRILDEDGFFGYTQEYEYWINGLKVNDTIEISFSYDIPFRENLLKILTNRIFFHSRYPQKNYSLTWCHNKRLEADTAFVNHSNAVVTEDETNICYSWEYQNLPGCLDEPGSRPYLNLPHFLFVPKSYDFIFTHYDSYIEEIIPPYFLQSSTRQGKLQSEYWDNIIGNTNKNNIHYQKFTNHILSYIPEDTIGHIKMMYLQKYIVDSVKYNSSYAYYNHDEDQIRQRAGVELNAGQIKDQNIERIYGNLIPRLELDYYTAYPIDKRAGVISEYYTSAVEQHDLIFATILKNNTIGYVIPKSDKNNYYFEELPFYYEDIPVLLLHFMDFPNEIEKRNFNTEFRKGYTPKSDFTDNFRTTQSQVNINIENGNSVFKTRIKLSGQYSTLTRCVYLDKPIDSTINPVYHQPIWKITEDTKLTNLNVAESQFYYPFQNTIIADYSTDSLLTKTSNGYSLKAGNLFKIPYNKTNNDLPRATDYFPDFVGSDKYVYFIQFTDPVKLVSSTEEVNISNGYADLVYSVKQNSPQALMVNLDYKAKAPGVGTENFDLVKEINSALDNISKSVITLEIAE